MKLVMGIATAVWIFGSLLLIGILDKFGLPIGTGVFVAAIGGVMLVLFQKTLDDGQIDGATKRRKRRWEPYPEDSVADGAAGGNIRGPKCMMGSGMYEAGEEARRKRSQGDS